MDTGGAGGEGERHPAKANGQEAITFPSMTNSDFQPLLAASAATPAFRADLEAFMARQPATRIRTSPGNPRVKVLRAIAQLLHAEPSLAVDSVEIRAASGCADFVGGMQVTDADGATHAFDFEWNCEWKARQLGYVDYFGFPDQIRAAQEFDWQCFERWTRATVRATQPA